MPRQSMRNSVDETIDLLAVFVLEADHRKSRDHWAPTLPRLNLTSASTLPRRVEKINYASRPSTHNPERDGPWTSWYVRRHATISGANALARSEKKLADIARASRKPKKALEGKELEYAIARRDRSARRRAEEKAFLALNPVLPSQLHPMLALFLAKVPRAPRLQVGRDKLVTWSADSKLLGMAEPYVHGNRAMRGFLRIDLDKLFSSQDETTWFETLDRKGWDVLREAIAAAGLPMPNLAVGEGASTGEHQVQNPHVLFMLADSVNYGPKGRVKFKSRMEEVERRLVLAFQEFGSDPGGLSNCTKTKNPLSPAWAAKVFRDAPWSMDELAEALPEKVSRRKLDKAFAAKEASDPVADHPDARIASQSNAIHSAICKYAQAAVGRFRASSTRDAFIAHVLEECLRICPDDDAARAKAKYVAPWTWDKFRGRVEGVKLSPKDLAAAHAKRGEKSGQTRLNKSKSAVEEAYYSLLSETGKKPLQCQVANRAGVCEKTAWRYIPGPSKGKVYRPKTVSTDAVVKKESFNLGLEKTTMAEPATVPAFEVPSEPSSAAVHVVENPVLPALPVSTGPVKPDSLRPAWLGSRKATTGSVPRKDSPLPAMPRIDPSERIPLPEGYVFKPWEKPWTRPDLPGAVPVSVAASPLPAAVPAVPSVPAHLAAGSTLRRGASSIVRRARPGMDSLPGL